MEEEVGEIFAGERGEVDWCIGEELAGRMGG